MSEAAARATQANAPANAAGRPSVIQLVFREKGALYAAYIPLFTDGGLIMPRLAGGPTSRERVSEAV